MFRTLDKKRMRTESAAHLKNLGISTLQNITQAVETLSGGQRQAVAVARAAAFGSQVIILDEPTAALGVNESARVLKMIQDLRDRGLSVILISHNMPQVFEVADRIHVARLGKRAAVVTPADRIDERRGGHHDRRHDGARGASSSSPPCASSTSA